MGCNKQQLLLHYICLWVYMHTYIDYGIYCICIVLFRVMKGIGHEIISGESETLVAVKMLKGDVLMTI